MNSFFFSFCTVIHSFMCTRVVVQVQGVEMVVSDSFSMLKSLCLLFASCSLQENTSKVDTVIKSQIVWPSPLPSYDVIIASNWAN